MRERDDGLANAMRAAGGVLLGLGALVVFVRRSSGHHWGDFALLLTLALPTALLFSLAVAGRTSIRAPGDPTRSVLLITALLLAPLAILQLLHWLGANTGNALYLAAVLVVSAALAGFGARRADSPYAILPAGLALLGAWLAVWSKILPHESADTVRVLILGGGVVLLLIAGAIDLTGGRGAGEMATAGGLGIVLAGIQGVFIAAFSVAFDAVNLVTSVQSHPSAREVVTLRPHEQHLPLSPQLFHPAGAQTTPWDVYLLVVSLALVWFGARSRLRGPAYVGTFGLLAFAASIAAQLSRQVAGHGPTSSLLGWPLVLVVLGAAGLLAPAWRRRAG